MRLELSVKTDLAIRALRRLADDETRMVPRAELADELRTTPDFLARVLAPLVRAEWVESRPGKSGGYRIATAARTTSVLDVVAAVEGLPGDGRCVLRSGPCDPDERCALHTAWTRARDAMLAELSAAPVIPT